ncbi:MAG: hypothetical protein PHY14_03950 [Candidatus Gracilibacteria bacterium]|nr:hypothetical protein [Candidatus Gracilibacteria bacterium]
MSYTMLHFDKNTLERWNISNIKDITCVLENGGCEGMKLNVREGIAEGDFSIAIDGSEIRCSIEKDSLPTFEDAYITHTPEGNWILSSKNILTRCGCGKSFQTKSGDPKIDKIKLLKSKLHEKNHTHHH